MSSFAGSLIISVLILTIGYAVSSILRKDTLYPLIAIAGVFLYISALTVMYITGIISSEFFRTQSQVFRVIGIVLISLSGSKGSVFYSDYILILASIGFFAFTNNASVGFHVLALAFTLVIWIYIYVSAKKTPLQSTSDPDQLTGLNQKKFTKKYPKLPEYIQISAIVFALFNHVLCLSGLIMSDWTIVYHWLAFFIAGTVGMNVETDKEHPECFVFGILLAFSSIFSLVPVYKTIIIVIQCSLAGILWYYLRKNRIEGSDLSANTIVQD